MIAANYNSGDFILSGKLRDEVFPGDGPMTFTRTIGSLDAPDMMPAGACCVCEICEGAYSFPAQLLSLRG